MNRKKRRRNMILLTFLILSAAVCLLFVKRMAPLIREMAMTRVSNEASFAINRAVLRQIQADNISYDHMIVLEKDVNGRICAIKTNMAEINRLQTLVLEMVDEEVLELSVSEVGLPMGNLIFPVLFSGRGPRLPVQIMAVSTSDAAFSSRFSTAGINQTLHQILLTVTATMTVLTPFGTETVTAESQMIVAETVIVGTVPQTYLQNAKTS